MTKWTIYGKDGTPKHESITKYNSDGKIVYQDTFEYSGKWMGECFLTVSVKSAYPIDFQIGDYIDYRGERFTINYDPTVIKKARRGTYGEGFVYDNIKFNSLSDELTQIRFHDWVLSDNKLHYTSLPNFSFFCKDVDDLVDRLQANTDRWCKANGFDIADYWMFYTLKNNTSGTSDSGQTQTTYDRTVQRAVDVLESCGVDTASSAYTDFLSQIQENWESVYGTGDNYKDSRDDERYDRTVSASGNTVWEMMSAIKQQFGLNFIIRGRNVYVGKRGVITSGIFKYGKGNGLYEVDKTADQDQLVVTKLHAYGSNENLPTRYYANLNTVVYSEVTDIFWRANHTVEDHNTHVTTYCTEFLLGMKYRVGMFDNPTYYDRLGQKCDEVQGYVVKFHIKDSTSILTGMVEAPDYQPTYEMNSPAVGYVQIQMYLYDGTGNTWEWQMTDKDAFDAFADALEEGIEIVFDEGVDTDYVLAENKTVETDNLPDNMAVNYLMLPGFPNNALADICRAEYNETDDVTNYYITNPSTGKEVLFHTEDGNHIVVFSADKYDPYVLSPNAGSIGIREGDIFCNEENDDNGLKKVYPTIEEVTDQDAGTGSTGTRLDTIAKADTIDDNGVWPNDKTTEIPGFNLWLPALGFNLRQAAKDAGGSEAKIAMKNGFCGGREFEVTNIEEDDGLWKLSCKRSPDNDLDLYFPYSYAKSVSRTSEELEQLGMTDAYQILPGDNYVLTGISIDDINYVWAASVKLLRKAIHWLLKNDYTRYVYSPKIDDIYMAREQQETAEGESLHDTLKEGDIMLFEDEDLLLDGAVYIDQLNIKENGNNGIPTYEVTLRNEIQVGTLQRIQNQVDSLRTDLASGTYSGSGGLGATDVDTLIKAYGIKYYLSKLNDDSAQGVITFLKGILLGDGSYGITEEGAATLKLVTADSGSITNLIASLLTGLTELKGNGFTTDDVLAGLGLHMYHDDNGNAHIVTDYITTRKKFYASTLEVRQTEASAGSTFQTSAANVIVEVEKVSDANGDGYKCWFLLDDGDGETYNLWKVGDQALCKVFKAYAGISDNVSNHYFFRLVTEVGTETREYDTDDADVKVERKMGYVVLSNATDSDGNPASFSQIYPDGTTSSTPVVPDSSRSGIFTGFAADSDAPLVGDPIIQAGSQVDEGRMKAVQIVVSAINTEPAPAVNFYSGINQFDLGSCVAFSISPDGIRGEAKYMTLKITNNAGEPIQLYNYRGTWSASLTYIKNDMVAYNGQSWIYGGDETKGSEPSEAGGWTIVAKSGADGKDAESTYAIRLTSSAGTVGGGATTITANVFRGDEQITDYTGLTFIWELTNADGTGRALSGTDSNVKAITGTNTITLAAADTTGNSTITCKLRKD